MLDVSTLSLMNDGGNVAFMVVLLKMSSALTYFLLSMKIPLPAFVLRCNLHGSISRESLSMAASTPGVIPQLYQRPSVV